MSGQNKVKQYVRASERSEYGMGGKASNAAERSLFIPLSFDACALTMQPFKDPVMAPSGAVYVHNDPSSASLSEHSSDVQSKV